MEDDDGTVDEPAAYERSVRATAIGRGTSGVPEVRRLVEDAFSTAFPRRLWAAGLVGRVRRDDAGVVHFRLHSSGDPEPFHLPCQVPADAVPQIADVLDRVHDAEMTDVLLEGRLARVGGLLRFDVPSGGPVLFVSALDPAPTARGLVEERELGLAVARTRGLPAHQRRRTCRTAPLRVALVGGVDDPGLARVRERLATSGYRLQLHEGTVPLRGSGAPAALGGALREAAVRSDLVLLVRESGRPLGLGVFDRPEVVQAVADAPVPVVSALGGGGQKTVCDEVAYATLPTADDAASWLLAQLRVAERELRGLRDEVAEGVRAASDRARDDLETERATVEAAGEVAEQRAEFAHRRLWTRLLIGAAVLAVVLVGIAIGSSRPVLLTGLLLMAALLAGGWLWSTRGPRRGIRRMGAQDEEFAGVLEHLREVRDQLSRTSNPETVRRLRELAAQLVGRGQEILGRDLEPPAPSAPPRPVSRTTTARTVDLDAHRAPAGDEGAVRVVRLDDPEATQALPAAAASGRPSD